MSLLRLHMSQTIPQMMGYESIHSSGLLVGGNVDPFVSQHVHAGSQQSRVSIEIKKLLHE